MIEQFRQARRRIAEEIGDLVASQIDKPDKDDWRLKNKTDEINLWRHKRSEANRNIRRLKREVKAIKQNRRRGR